MITSKRKSKTVHLTGVYCIYNRENGKRYVGSAATSLLSRMRNHRYKLGTNKHKNKHLQSAWNIYGKESFLFQVLQKCAPEDCLKTEQEWIDFFDSANNRNGYNKSPVSGSSLGVKRTEEQRHRMSLSRKGKPGTKHTPESKAKISAAKKRIKQKPTKLCLERCRAVHLGRKASDETKEKMSAARKGRKHSAEHSKSISEALTGRTLSPEHRKKIGESKRGRKISEEERVKRLGNRNAAGKRTPEICARISIAVRAALAKQRETK